MSQTDLIQNVDFLSIALESLESNSTDVAEEFIIDVQGNLLDLDRREQARRLQEAVESNDEEETYEIVGDVYEELKDEI